MPDWRVDVLAGLGAPPTKQNLALLSSWQRWEGGHTNNDARYNWLNTTRDAPGAVREINSVGVKAFDSYQSGIGATIATLMNGRYGGIVSGLRSGNPQANPDTVRGLSTWVSGSPTKGVKYAGDVLGIGKIGAWRLLNGRGGSQSAPTPTAEAAQTAFLSGPAGIAYGPSPGQFKALQAQTLLAMSQAAFSGDGFQIAGAALQLAQQRQQFAAATRGYAGAALNAAKTGGTIEPSVPPRANDPRMQAVLEIAAQQIGKPYVWGAESPEEGFDCSGLIDYAFKRAGIKLPGRLTTYTAMQLGKSVKGSTLQPGDWLITNGGKHMVMYYGDGQVIASPRRGEVVQFQPVSRFKGDIVDVRRYA